MSSPLRSQDQIREDALSHAMNECGRYILWHLNNLCQDQGLAEDLYQKLWVYVYKSFEQRHFTHVGFLKRKATQLHIDELRKRQRRPDLSFVETLPEPWTPQNDEPLGSEDEKDLFESFWSRFSVLGFSEKQKQIFWFHARYGYTLEEVGQRFGIGKSATHEHYQNVKKRCLEFLTTSANYVS